MCVIAIVNNGVALKKSDVKSMWEANPHGAGLAIYKGGKWEVIKGLMTLDKVYEVLSSENLLEREDTPPFVIHFRVASVGDVTPELTHPFQFRVEEGDAFLFHNGTLEMSAIEPGLSDTAQMAKLLDELGLSKSQLKTLVKEKGLLEPLRRWSRFAICLPGEEEPFLVGKWEKVRGLLVSNTYWELGKTFTGLEGKKSSSRSYSGSYGYIFGYDLWDWESSTSTDCDVCETGLETPRQLGQLILAESAMGYVLQRIVPESEWAESNACLTIISDTVYLVDRESRDFEEVVNVLPLDVVVDFEDGEKFIIIDKLLKAFLAASSKKSLRFYRLKHRAVEIGEGQMVYAVDMVLPDKGVLKW